MVRLALDQDAVWSDGIDWEGIAHHAAVQAIQDSDFAGFIWLENLEISVLLSDNNEVRTLNNQWRGKDSPTNVLSFPMLEAEELQKLKNDPDSAYQIELSLGDIIVARSVCIAEAAEKNIPLADHVTHLIVHGTLHLLGYDHIDDTQAEHMEGLEVKALASLGLANPYNDDPIHTEAAKPI